MIKQENDGISPLKVTSVKDSCVRLLENKILSGEWKIGMRLPSERSLAQSLEISRIILHEALVDLAAKGLVIIQPRKGIYVNDFRTNGSCNLLSSIMNFQNSTLDPDFTKSLIEMRLLLESETSRLAASHRTNEHMTELKRIHQEERGADRANFKRLTDLDFTFHQQIAVASGNLMYPLIINSFKNVYTKLTGLFFENYHNQPEVTQLLEFHQNLIQSIQSGDEVQAEQSMRELLMHGSKCLLQILEGSN
jgi:GntR family transcriptional repressor for pyruvate dehydrogenase complex